jgi:hypothetical protein
MVLRTEAQAIEGTESARPGCDRDMPLAGAGLGWPFTHWNTQAAAAAAAAAHYMSAYMQYCNRAGSAGSAGVANLPGPG